MTDPRFGMAIASLAAAGLFDTEREPRCILIDNEQDIFSSNFLPFDDERPRQRYPWVRETVEHYETPKPLTKRQKRRLRGRP